MADGLERPPPEERKRDPGQGNRALENGTQNTASYQAAESERQAAILIGSDAAVYEAYPIKRHRSTKREVWQRRLRRPEPPWEGAEKARSCSCSLAFR